MKYTSGVLSLALAASLLAACQNATQNATQTATNGVSAATHQSAPFFKVKTIEQFGIKGPPGCGA